MICSAYVSVLSTLTICSITANNSQHDAVGRLGEAFVASLRNRDYIAIGQCWIPHQRLHELIESYGNQHDAVPPETRKRYDSLMAKRNRMIIQRMSSALACLQEHGVNVEELKLLSITADVPVTSKNRTVDWFSIILGYDNITIHWMIDDGVQIGGMWYFSDVPESKMKITKNNMATMIDLDL